MGGWEAKLVATATGATALPVPAVLSQSEVWRGVGGMVRLSSESHSLVFLPIFWAVLQQVCPMVGSLSPKPQQLSSVILSPPALLGSGGKEHGAFSEGAGRVNYDKGFLPS